MKEKNLLHIRRNEIKLCLQLCMSYSHWLVFVFSYPRIQFIPEIYIAALELQM